MQYTYNIITYYSLASACMRVGWLIQADEEM